MTDTTGHESLEVGAESLATRRVEVAEKVGRARALMEREGAGALLLTSVANTAWLTAGAATYVNESVEDAACSLLLTADEALVLTDPIEAPRLRDEERLEALGFTFVIEPWYARGAEVARRAAGGRLASDAPGAGGVNVGVALVALRSRLTPGEQARLREGARRAGMAMWEAVRALRPGMSEWAVAAEVAAASRRHGGAATVALVGSDERVSRYRHPLPTAKPIGRYVMLVLCFRYRGLVSALTRSVTFGEPPDALRETAQAVARIDAEVIAGTRPGRTLGEMFSLLADAYRRAGQQGAIEEHHQGGTIAYLGRETLARPDDLTVIQEGMAFAWNPSLRGAKSEDTTLLTPQRPEIVTRMEGWPLWQVETDGGIIERPALLALPR